MDGIQKSKFWFADGNIVIIAGPVAFKVHRGQLERHSEIFHDLFSIPQPAEQELIDGCPCVELHDPPQDVLYLLMALYDGLYFDKSSVGNFPIIAAVLRLSTKYVIEHLRQRCLVHLGADWPSTLEGWDARENAAIDKHGTYSPRDTCAHPTLVIQLATALDLRHLLLAAYYDLSRYGPRRIISGAPVPSPSPVPSKDERAVVYLERHELQMVLLGREAGQRFLSAFIETELTNRPVAAQCTNRHHDAGRVCRESTYYVMLNVLRAVGGVTHGRDADVLFTLTQTVDMLSRTDFTDGVRRCGLKICAACKEDLAACVAKARQHVWHLIPQWFGLEAGPVSPGLAGGLDTLD
ncbi:uncharacterized protein PHACADRAFT_188574 [Phanerochaete carnosa HHB-10118-sp]|uniref:BTB domain-containing protein n=1 Tax=Phanerochaete carnosa (strain HHB-10118-sp) TaxID=650164 RepID=K5WJD7_PHACS|nr:uncharacterized protein PHACADRAFT_188574 [Phanerochaete carnosa HHB-10118-sp]EKM50332.1 hypothetical protein PHACADRAFT_188574 [Phanerochaete carnosa HHB-10118-sp]